MFVFNKLEEEQVTFRDYEGLPNLEYYYGEEIGEYFRKSMLANVRYKDKDIKITQDVKGGCTLWGDDFGGYSPGFPAHEIKYNFQVGDKHFAFDLKDDDRKAFSYDGKLQRGKLLTSAQLEEMLEKGDLSKDDFLSIAFNLNLRYKMPEKLRDFTDMRNLEEKIKNDPENLRSNVKSLLPIVWAISNKIEIKSVLYNLRNTKDKKFNLLFKREMQKLISELEHSSDYSDRFAGPVLLKPLTKSKFLGYNPTKAIMDLKIKSR